MDIRQHHSIKPLLLLVYLLAVLILVALLIDDYRREIREFSLSRAVTMAGPHADLSVHGENFHADLKGVVVNSLVNEKALIRHLLPDMPSKSVDVQEGLALASCNGSRLISIGMPEGEPPKLLGSIEMPDSIAQIMILGDRALVALLNRSGLALVDLRNPGDLQLVEHYALNGLVASMARHQDSVYFADIYQGVGRIDLSAENPVPELLVELDSPWRMSLHGGRLVAGTMKGGVHLFNIARDGRLVAVADFVLPLNVRGVVLTEEVLAVALADNTLYLFDVSSWPQLGDPVTLQLPGLPMLLEPVPGRPAIAAGLIGGGMVMVDITQATAPQLAGHLKIPRTFYAMKLQTGKVWGASKAGLQVFALDEIARGDEALLATQATLSQSHFRLFARDGHVYGFHKKQLTDIGGNETPQTATENPFLAVADEDGVHLFELAGGDRVRPLGYLPVDGGAADALWRDQTLYVVNQNGLQLFSGIRPEELVAVKKLPLPGRFMHLAWLGTGHLLMANFDNELLVVDVGDPQRPLQIGSMAPPEHLRANIRTQGMLVDGQRAFLSQGADVHVIDVSIPTRPELRQIIRTPGIAKNMVIHDDLLLVADGVAGIFMIDARNRARAVPIGAWPMPLRVDGIAAAGDSLIATSPTGGTLKLPLPRRLKNLKVIGVDKLQASTEMDARGQYVYIYDEHSAAQIKVNTQ